MRSLAVVVPAHRGEATRRSLVRDALLRGDLKIVRREGRLWFPVARAPDPLPEGGALVEEEFEVSDADRRSWYGAIAEVPEEVRARLPRAFDVVGAVAVLRIPSELEPYKPAIGAALLAFLPGVRLVAEDEGVAGPFRVRRLRRLAGAGDFTTVHAENGLRFEVDLERAYFSPRLGREHARVAEATRPGEPFWDLCAGVGPFGLTAGRRAGAGPITLVDANPAAVALAGTNARSLGIADRVRVVEARVEEFLPSVRLSGRVVLNLPLEGTKYLTQVGDAAGRGVTLHYYEVMARRDTPDRLAAIPGALGPAGAWTVLESHVVHPYSPSDDLRAVTLRRESD